MTLIEAAKLAREALEDALNKPMWNRPKMENALAALDQAIAKAEQQPDHTEQHLEMVGKQEAERDSDCKESDGCPTEKSVLQRFWREAQQQEPVVHVGDLNEFTAGYLQREGFSLDDPLYAHPPQRTWVGLTDGEWVNILNKNNAWHGYSPDRVAHEVCALTEAKLKKKNT